MNLPLSEVRRKVGPLVTPIIQVRVLKIIRAPLPFIPPPSPSSHASSLSFTHRPQGASGSLHQVQIPAHVVSMVSFLQPRKFWTKKGWVPPPPPSTCPHLRLCPSTPPPFSLAACLIFLICPPSFFWAKTKGLGTLPTPPLPPPRGLRAGGALRFVSGLEEPLGLRVVINGITHMIPNVIDPSELRSDVNGRLSTPPPSMPSPSWERDYHGMTTGEG